MSLITLKTATDRSTSAPIPKATAVTWTKTPACPPTAEPTPAVRPSISDRLMTNRTFGPGTMMSAKETSAHASR